MNGNCFHSPLKREGKGFTHVYLSVCSMAVGGIPLDGGQASS